MDGAGAGRGAHAIVEAANYKTRAAVGTPGAWHGAQALRAPTVEAEVGSEPPSGCGCGPMEASRVGPRRQPWLRPGRGLSGTSLGNDDSSRIHRNCS